MANPFSFFDELFSNIDTSALNNQWNNNTWWTLQNPTQQTQQVQQQTPQIENMQPENNWFETPEEEKTWWDKVLDFWKAVTELPDKILWANWVWAAKNALDTSLASSIFWIPWLIAKWYTDYNKSVEKWKHERRKEAGWYDNFNNNEEPKNIFTWISNDEIAESDKDDELSIWEKAEKTWYEVRNIANNIWMYSFANHLQDDARSWYVQAIQDLYDYKQWIKDWSITEAQYKEKLKELTQTLLDNYLNDDWKVLKERAAESERELNGYMTAIDWDVGKYWESINLREKLNKIDPYWETWSQWNALSQITNNAVQNIMDSVNERLKSYKWESSEIVRDLYEVAQDEASDLVNAYAPTRSVLTKLQSKYWTDDPQFYSTEDREFYNRAKRIENDILGKILSNQADYYTNLIDYVDPSTDTLVMPERVKWLTLHEWNLRWLENVLTDDDYKWLWWYWWAWSENWSPQDLISAMSANLMADYIARNGWWFDSLWTSTQRFFRPIWPITQEVGQQVLWQAYLSLIYNPLSEDTWKIPFSFVDEDNSILSILSTNKSTKWRLIQKYTANIIEYAPELIAEIWATAFWAWIPSRIRNVSEFRLLMNTRWWSTFKKIKAASKAKGISVLEWVKEAADTWKIVHNWWTLFDAGKDIGNIRNWERALTWWVTDFVPEAAWDQVIDASLSSIDSDFGSDTSMVFSLWGTVLWNIVWKLWELWLYRMWGNLLDNLVHLSNQPITRWTVWDMLNMLDESNINKIVKLQFWKWANINTAWLWELSRYVNDYREIAKATRKALSSLSGEEARRVTKAIKDWVYEEIKPYINQVYGWQSSFAKKVAQLVADDRTNVADLTKYLLWISNKIDVFWWKSAITLADWKQRYAWNYKEDIDTVFNQWNFRDRLRDWFDLADLEALKKAWYSWADTKSWYMRKVGDNKYFFTKDWLDAAKNDIMTTSLNVKTLAKASQSAEEFDSLMKNSTLRNISDDTLQDIKDSWAYDVLADMLWEIDQLCKINVK